MDWVDGALFRILDLDPQEQNSHRIYKKRNLFVEIKEGKLVEKLGEIRKKGEKKGKLGSVN